MKRQQFWKRHAKAAGRCVSCNQPHTNRNARQEPACRCRECARIHAIKEKERGRQKRAKVAA